MAITLADFRLQFPEFDSVADARIQLYIDESVLCFDICQWGDFLNLGMLYYVAFNVQLYEVQQSDPSTGAAVSDKAAGALRVGLAIEAMDLMNTDAFFLANKYGQKYLELRNKAVIGVLTARVREPLSLSAC